MPSATRIYNLIEDTRGFISLSYQFDLPHGSNRVHRRHWAKQGRGELVEGVDLLVSEIIDPEYALAAIKRSRPDLSKDEPFFHFRMITMHCKVFGSGYGWLAPDFLTGIF